MRQTEWVVTVDNRNTGAVRRKVYAREGTARKQAELARRRASNRVSVEMRKR